MGENIGLAVFFGAHTRKCVKVRSFRSAGLLAEKKAGCAARAHPLSGQFVAAPRLPE